MRNQKITKEIIRQMIDDMTIKFKQYIITGPKTEPAIFHYYRLISQGHDNDKAMKMVLCVSAMLTLGKMSGTELPNSYINKLYESLPESDAEKYLYGLCE